MTTHMVKLRRTRLYKNGGSLFVLVPAPWANEMGLGEGGEVDLFRDMEDNLIVKPTRKTTDEEE